MAVLRSEAAARRQARRAYNLALPKHQIDLVALRRVWALPLACALFIGAFVWFLVTGDTAAIAPCILCAALVALCVR